MKRTICLCEKGSSGGTPEGAYLGLNLPLWGSVLAATVGSAQPSIQNMGACVDESQILCRESLQYLWEMRGSRLLCDGLLKTNDGGEFSVHRVVMASCSEYFRALFVSGLRSSGREEFLIPGVSKATLAIIVEFAYKRITWVGCDNVESLLEAADYLCVMEVVKDCCDFLVSIMAPQNCVSIHSVAKTYNCFALAKRAYNYLMHNFTDVATKGDELLGLPIEQVEAIFSDENLNVVKEETVWNAVVRWIDFEPTSRWQYTRRLLSCVRTGLVGVNFFVERIKGHKYVAHNEACRDLAMDTLLFLYDFDVALHNDTVPTPLFVRPRIPHDMMFVIGGWTSGRATHLIESYDTKADRWIKLESVDPVGPRAYHECVVIGYDIYVIGGLNGGDYFRSVCCFNANTKKWRSVTPMHYKRCYVSVAVLNDIIYAMGGFDGRHRQNTAEKFDYRTNQWTMIATMNAHRSDACGTTHDGYVYVTGGFSGSECLGTAERYDPTVDQWSLISPMKCRRSGVGCVGFRDYVYAVGGFNGTSRLSSAEKYNPETNIWTPLTNMYTQRSNLAVCIIDDLLFAIGGYNGETTTNLVECYDPTTGQWYQATDMNSRRSAMAACVVAGLPNVRDYIHQRRDNLMEEKRQKMLDVLMTRSRQASMYTEMNL